MYTVLLDSSGTYLAVGLAKDGKFLKGIFYEAWQQQSEFMVVELNKLLNEFSVEPTDIDSIVVCVGPGSYTGVRISITIAKTLALACNAKVYPVSSLWAERNGEKPSICLINARSKRSYIGVYEGKKCLLKDQIMTNSDVLKYIEENKEFSVCGDTKYLGFDGEISKILKEMLALKDVIEPIDNPLALKPIYMCD